MNLTSCDNCGVVLDASKLNFPENLTLYDGSIDDQKAMWDGNDFVAMVECPVCNCGIPKSE